MSYCVKCGKELVDGANFCAGCGIAVGVNNNSQRQQRWMGEIVKCPRCGADIPSFTSICSTCGHEFRGAGATNSVNDFFDNYMIANDDEKEHLIRSFPIPNTKEDIFEFMILASTNIVGEQQKKVFDAWFAKFEQSYQKAQLVIQDSSDMDKISSIYEKTHKQINKEKFVRNAKNVGDTITRSSNLFSKIFLIIAKNAGVIAGLILFIIAINMDKSGENSAMHELIGVILLIASAVTLKKRDASLMEILIGAGSGALSILLASQLENGAMLELGGVVVLIIVVVSFFAKISKKGE